MIWVGGRVVPDEALAISALDRTFEHGLGLFETFRTWRGRPVLMDRHLARLSRSADALGIPLDRSALPDAEAVATLLRAAGFEDDVLSRIAAGFENDALLRITLTGGVTRERGSTLWMRAAPLPLPPKHDGAVVDFGSWKVVRNIPLLRHKTLNYWERRLAFERARELGLDEVLSMSQPASLWEGSRTNLFLVKGEALITPTLDGPVVPGIMRALVLELARRLPLDVRAEGDVSEAEFLAADEVFLTNSVRGLIPIQRAGQRAWPAPGPWTQRLRIEVADWLSGGGTTP